MNEHHDRSIETTLYDAELPDRCKKMLTIRWRVPSDLKPIDGDRYADVVAKEVSNQVRYAILEALNAP